MRRYPWLAALLAATVIAGCVEDHGPVEVLFDPAADDLAGAPFPSDVYRVDALQGLVAGFSDEQFAALPFLRHLPLTAQIAWWTGGEIRVPVTASPALPERWVDLDSAAVAVRLFRLETDRALRVPIAPPRYASETGALFVRSVRPLAPGDYAVVVRAGDLRTRAGLEITGSRGYEAIQLAGDPATDAAFDLVATASADIDDRADTLAFVQLTTGDDTAQMALLQAYLEGELPVDRLGEDELLEVTSFLPAEEREISVGAVQVLAADASTVPLLFDSLGLGALPSAGIARVSTGLISTPVFVSDPKPQLEALFTNGTFLGRDPALPFMPTNPLSLSASTPFRTIPFVLLVPAVHADPMPVAVVAHGLGLGKESVLPLANALCSAGYAVLAIDAYQHGARQTDIAVPEGTFAGKLDPVSLAADAAFPDPFFGSTFVGRTRDKLRQTVVDHMALMRLLASADGKGPVDLDGDTQPDQYGKQVFIGLSLGALIGAPLAAVSPHPSRVVFSGPGADLAAIWRESPALGATVSTLMYATGNAAGIGILADLEIPLLPDTAERELYDVVASTVFASVDPFSYAPHIFTGALGGRRPRVLAQFGASDSVFTPHAAGRFVEALAAGALSREELPLIVDGDVNQEWFDVDLATHDVTVAGPPTSPSFVAQFAGDHLMVIDFADVEVTAAAQLQIVEFLLAP